MELNIFWDLPAYLLIVLLVFVSIIAIDKLRHKKSYYQKKSSFLVIFAKDLFWIVLIVFVLRAFIIEPFRIPSGSMIPNLLIGDFVLVNKSSYGINLPLFNYPIVKYSDIKRGDVIVFRYPNDPNIPFIKRVVATPGDEIAYKNKTLYINGKAIINQVKNNYDQNHILYDEFLNSQPIKILKNPNRITLRDERDSLEKGVIVPEGKYFVMGDNRDNSNDSRFWGYVPEHLILGKAVLVWANITTDGNLMMFDWDEFKRFFTTVNFSFDSAGKIKTGREE